VTPRPLSTGSAFHVGVAAAYSHVRDAQRANEQVDVARCAELALEAVEAKLGEYLRELHEKLAEATSVDVVDKIVEDSRTMVHEARGSVVRYVESYVAEDAKQYQVIAIEEPFTVPLVDAGGRARPRVAFAGVQDLVLFDPVMKDYVLGEHKTTSMDATLAESKLDMDPQTTGYVYALRQMAAKGGLQGALSIQQARVGRVFYNVTRKTGPGLPNVNKDGTVSVAAVDTSRAVYQAALDKQGEPEWYKKDPTKQKKRWQELQDKQRRRLESLPAVESRWLCRHEAYHSPDAVERWRKETLAEAGLLRSALNGSLAITRNPNECNMPWSPRCPYRSVCIEDSPELRRELRVVSDPHVEVVEAEESAA